MQPGPEGTPVATTHAASTPLMRRATMRASVPALRCCGVVVVVRMNVIVAQMRWTRGPWALPDQAASATHGNAQNSVPSPDMTAMMEASTAVHHAGAPLAGQRCWVKPPEDQQRGEQGVGAPVGEPPHPGIRVPVGVMTGQRGRRRR